MSQKPKKPASYHVRDVPYEGIVGAGKVIPFVAKGGSFPAAVPDYIPDSEPLGTMTVSGGSLARVGILDGDIVLCRKVFHKRDIRNDTVCIVYIPATGEVVAKKIKFREGSLVLRYCGYDGESDRYVSPDEVEIRGIVISASRHRTEWPFVDDPYEDVPL